MNPRLKYLLMSNKLVLFVLFIMLALLVITPFLLPKKKLVVTPSPTPNLSIYPTSQPQQFNRPEPEKFGSLVVNSNVAATEVTIDEKEVKDPEFYAPKNYTPFAINNIPAGKHILRANKIGYLSVTLEVQVEAGEAKEVKIDLKVNPEVKAINEAVKEMPVSTDEYYIEYLSRIGKIQTIIKKAPYEENKQKAVEWFKERGIQNPEAGGILFYPALGVKQ